MVQLDGTYEFVSEENYLEYLKSLGQRQKTNLIQERLNDEQAQKQASVKASVTIKNVTGENITVSYNGTEVTFPIGKELEYKLAIGHTIRTTAKVSGDTITFESKLTDDGQLTETRVFNITDSGLTSTSTNSKGAKTIRKYKRV